MFAIERLITAVSSRNASWREAGVEQRLRAARQLELLLGDRPLARLANRHAERAGGLVEEAGVEPGLLGQLLARVERAVACEHALHGKQRQPVVRGGLAQLVEREALALERAQQLEPGVAVLGAVEQSLRLEVDSHAHIVP